MHVKVYIAILPLILSGIYYVSWYPYELYYNIRYKRSYPPSRKFNFIRIYPIIAYYVLYP